MKNKKKKSNDCDWCKEEMNINHYIVAELVVPGRRKCRQAKYCPICGNKIKKGKQIDGWWNE